MDTLNHHSQEFARNQRRDPNDHVWQFAYGSNQHLARLPKKTLDMLLNLRIDHHLRPLAIRAGEPWRRSEQTADKRAFCVDLASIVAKVWAAQIG